MLQGIRRRVGVVAAGLAVATVAAVGVVAPAPSDPPRQQAVDVRLAADPVPLGALIATVVGNQGVYCSLICPLAVDTFASAAVTTLQSPAVFASVLSTGDVLRALGAAAESVTGPTDAAWGDTIRVDGTVVAPRAYNAFVTAVVGLMNVVPAAAGGLPGAVTALEVARRDTLAALNAPLVANPAPTAMPRGVVQVAVVGGLNVVAAVVFPAFNEVLRATTSVPAAAATELAATGDPVKAVAAGFGEAAERGRAAVAHVADAVETAVEDVREAAAPVSGAPESARMQTGSAPRESGTSPTERNSRQEPDATAELDATRAVSEPAKTESANTESAADTPAGGRDDDDGATGSDQGASQSGDADE